jgi:hypothetical protein
MNEEALTTLDRLRRKKRVRKEMRKAGNGKKEKWLLSKDGDEKH